MNSLLFFSAVDNNYEDFLILYIYFANKYNENSYFEFLIKNLNDDFIKNIDNFKNKFGIKNIVLRNYLNDDISADRLRFLEEPITKCDYTYIGDVDIFINESIREFHIDKMNKNCTIYDNCIRLKNRDKLSGLHFVKTKEWYESTRNIRTTLRNTGSLKIDEAMLFDIAKGSNIKIYENETFERPIHGLHISLNRVPFTENLTFPWGLYKSMFIDDFFKSEDFEKIKEFLSENMLNILEICTNYTIDKSNQIS